MKMGIFRSLAIAAALVGSQAAVAGGTYDGIWAASTGNTAVGYYSLTQNGNSLVAVALPLDSAGAVNWEAFIGGISGNLASVSTLVSTVNSSFAVTFTSATTATIVQVACAPKTTNSSCRFSNGTVLLANKIF